MKTVHFFIKMAKKRGANLTIATGRQLIFQKRQNIFTVSISDNKTS